MAKRNIKDQGTHPGGEGAEAPSGWQEALIYVRLNPMKVAGGVGFLLLCVVIGGFFSLKSMTEARKDNTRYAVADTIEDPSERAEALEKVANQIPRWQVEALYKAGEAFIRAKAYDKARGAFEKVLAEHDDSEYAPMAADGLAFLDENAGKLDEALQGYINVFEKWDDTLTGRREPYNIGRILEELGKPEEAIERYQKQVEIFPGSSVARKSQAALAKLKAKNPELFPEEEKPEEEVIEEVIEVSEDKSDVPTPAEDAVPTEAATPEQEAAAAGSVTESTEKVAAEEAPAPESVETPAPEEKPAN